MLFDLINVSRILLREMGSRDVPFHHRQWRRLLQRRAECTHLTLQSSKPLFIFLPLLNAAFAPREKIIGNNKKKVLVVCFFSDAFIGVLSDSCRSQGRQSSFGWQLSPNPPPRVSWGNLSGPLIRCTTALRRNGHYWVFSVHLCLPFWLVPVYFGPQQNSLALYFHLASDDWKWFLWIKAEEKTPMVSIWTLEGWCVLLSDSIFKCMTLHRCSDSKSLVKSVISLQLVTTSAHRLRGERSSCMAENCKCSTVVNDNFFPQLKNIPTSDKFFRCYNCFEVHLPI